MCKIQGCDKDPGEGRNYCGTQSDLNSCAYKRMRERSKEVKAGARRDRNKSLYNIERSEVMRSGYF